MDNREYINLVFNRGKIQGFRDMEAYIVKKETINISAFKGECEKYIVSNERVLALRGTYEGKMGYSYTEILDPEQIDILLQDTLNSAKSKNSEEEEYIANITGNYTSVATNSGTISEATPEDKINFVLAMEKEALLMDKRIKSINYCAYEEENRAVLIKNTMGLECEDRCSFATVFLSVVAQADENIRMGHSFYTGNRFADFNHKKLAAAAVEDAVGMLKATSIESGNYEIILRNNVAAAMLQCFAPVFYADRVQKKLSILDGKLFSKIANCTVSIIDDPLMEDGVCGRVFDDEATTARAKYVVKNGILETYLHNNKTAAKTGLSSTGNGIRISHKSAVGIAPTNMYITKGRYSLDEMITSVGNGIMIIDIQGTHAGINPISGDFSLSSYGYLIENGKVKRPVNQITISGNISSLLRDIEYVGNDLLFGTPGNGYIGSPSLKLKSLAVAGG